MEILLLADYGGLPWDVGSIINTVRSSSEIQCFMKLTPWQKRQAEIAWLFDVSGCTDDATMRGLIRTLRAKLTPDERKSLLLAMRWMNWPFDTCPLQV